MEKDIYEKNDQSVNKTRTPAYTLIQKLIINNDSNLVDQIRDELVNLRNEKCDLADGLAFLSSFIEDIIKKPLNIARSLPKNTEIQEKLDLLFEKLKKIDNKISKLFVVDENANPSEQIFGEDLEKLCPFNKLDNKVIVDTLDETIEANLKMKRHHSFGVLNVKCGYLIDYLDIIDEYINSIQEYKNVTQQLLFITDKEIEKTKELSRAIQQSSENLINNFSFFNKSTRDQSIQSCLDLLKHGKPRM